MTNNFDIATPFLTTVFSSKSTEVGGAAGAFNIETFLAGKAIPSSIFAYLFGLYDKAVIL